MEKADTVVTGRYRLPATITLPQGLDDAPVVVLVHGSGPNDRDERVGPNRPFRDLAQMLARRGIGTLRYDKRTLVYKQPVSSIDDETTADALSALCLARTYSNKVYVLGHSLGGMMAPLIARADSLVQGVILMAAPARPLAQVVREQVEYLLPSGASEAFKQAQVEKIREHAPHYFRDYRQRQVAQSLSVPILVLQGERDYQVRMTDYRLWQQALGNHPGAQFHSYAKLNHLFLEGKGPSNPAEYNTPSHVPAYVADDIAAFLAQ